MREDLCVLLEVRYDTAWAQVLVTLLPSPGVETAHPRPFLHVREHAVHAVSPARSQSTHRGRGITVPCLEVKVAQADVAPG